jgi:hypothetical protein
MKNVNLQINSQLSWQIHSPLRILLDSQINRICWSQLMSQLDWQLSIQINSKLGSNI